MFEGKKVAFLCLWRIKRYTLWSEKKQRQYDSIVSSTFVFDNCEWKFILKHGESNLYISVDKELKEEIEKNFDIRYELVSPEGIIFRTSYFRSSYIHPYLISAEDLKDEMMSWPEDTLTFHFYIECDPGELQLASSEYSSTAFEIETKIYNCNCSAELPFQLNKLYGPSESRKIDFGLISVDINLSYVYDDYEIEVFSKGEDKLEHGVLFQIKLIDDKDSEINPDRSSKFKFIFEKMFLQSVYRFLSEKPRLKLCASIEYLSKIISCKDSMENERCSSSQILNTKFTESEPNCLSCLQHQMQSMFMDRVHADVKLRVDNEIFFTHKCLLAVRSPVFKAILESKSGIADIHDVNPKIMKFFLQYLYTGTVDEMDGSIASDLLVVADKYQVSQLREKCSKFLKSVLCLSNVLNVLSAADLVSEEQLKMCAMEYILKNSTKVLSLPDWEEWAKINIILAGGIVLQLSKKMKDRICCVPEPESKQPDMN